MTKSMPAVAVLLIVFAFVAMLLPFAFLPFIAGMA